MLHNKQFPYYLQYPSNYAKTAPTSLKPLPINTS